MIRPGDYILVTEAEPIYITGSVNSPQGVFMRDQLTLGRAIAMVGGTKKEAKLTDVRIYRQKPGSADQEMIKVDYAAIKKNQKPDILLQAYDIVEILRRACSPQVAWADDIRNNYGGLSSAMQSTGQIIPTRILYSTISRL